MNPLPQKRVFGSLRDHSMHVMIDEIYILTLSYTLQFRWFMKSLKNTKMSRLLRVDVYIGGGGEEHLFSEATLLWANTANIYRFLVRCFKYLNLQSSICRLFCKFLTPINIVSSFTILMTSSLNINVFPQHFLGYKILQIQKNVKFIHSNQIH